MGEGVYVYCIVNTGQKLDFDRKGFNGRRVYNVSYRELGAVVSDTPGFIYEVNEENILLHEEVIEDVMHHYTVLPVQFGTVLKDTEAVKALLEKFYPELTEKLSRLENKVEFGLKVIWPVDEIREEIMINEQAGNFEQDTEKTKKLSGEKYMLARMRDFRIQASLERRADELIAEIDGALRPYVEGSCLKKLLSEKLFLSAAYLVHKDRIGEFRERVRQVMNQYRKLKFLYSGPWPPYNFAVFEQPLSLMNTGRDSNGSQECRIRP
ncbi:GvpL/GvpF family gas vesicle protein [Desulfofundulus sp. TPOSR]|uniref:GvpL/GvpF family gas vesicle protein n=1 Tax=Desulfofundulus sp. TPOSR TaxID=2714340 RepID=UPI00140B9955|nr:GvpL/GvpF family gas vesicle protein [Desulfofundulus sp. TPOSR]NHM26759.1 GvpL/GvpF family gas vesicle protein [Desulfofundulus sp. TPOSR]